MRRPKSDYQDFRSPPERTVEPIVFFGGADYLKLFCALTSSITATNDELLQRREKPARGGLRTAAVRSTTKTNWHYECAETLLDGEIEPDFQVSTYAEWLTARRDATPSATHS